MEWRKRNNINNQGFMSEELVNYFRKRNNIYQDLVDVKYY